MTEEPYTFKWEDVGEWVYPEEIGGAKFNLGEKWTPGYYKIVSVEPSKEQSDDQS